MFHKMNRDIKINRLCKYFFESMLIIGISQGKTVKDLRNGTFLKSCNFEKLLSFVSKRFLKSEVGVGVGCQLEASIRTGCSEVPRMSPFVAEH